MFGDNASVCEDDLNRSEEINRLVTDLEIFGDFVSVSEDYASDDEKEVLVNENENMSCVYNDVVSASGDMDRDNFAARLREADRCAVYKWMEVRLGQAAAESQIDRVTLAYTLPLCPGSSGCPVMSYLVTDCVLHTVPHSKATGGEGGVSGEGTTYAMRKLP